MSVKLITFNTTQTILATIIKEDDVKLWVKNPVQTIVQPTEKGPIMNFLPFLEYSEEFQKGMEISKSNILTINTPLSKIQEQYESLFSSIQVVKSMPESLRTKESN